MIFRWLDSIRQKPKHVRDQYAFMFTLVLVAIVAGVWSLSVPGRLLSIADFESGKQKASAPFSGLWQNLKSQFGEVPNLVSEEAVTNLVEEAIREAEVMRNVHPTTTKAEENKQNIVLIATTTTATTSENTE